MEQRGGGASDEYGAAEEEGQRRLDTEEEGRRCLEAEEEGRCRRTWRWSERRRVASRLARDAARGCGARTREVGRAHPGKIGWVGLVAPVLRASKRRENLARGKFPRRLPPPGKDRDPGGILDFQTSPG